MKARFLLVVLVVAAAAGTAGWFAGRHRSAPGSSAPAGAAGRKILYYQSAMHPWIKSDQPGRCTICGMELSPVYEGEQGFDASAGLVTLGSNIIQVIHVQTDRVRRRPLQRSFRFAGTIDDDETRHRVVSAYVDGRIDKLHVNYLGAEVVAGEPLATLYSPLLLAAEREYVTLFQQRGASATPSALETAAAHRLKRFGLSEAQIEALPQKDPAQIHTQVLAPASGSVVGRFVYEGQYVKEGDKLFELGDFSTMWFLFDAYERDLAWIRPGQRVSATTPSAPGLTFTGVVAFIDPNLKEMSRSTKVRVELPNPLVEEGGRQRRALYHKLYADAVVQVEIPEVLAVPRSAVLSPGGTPVAYVDQGGGAYAQRRLRLGRAGDEFYEVLEGLAEGEPVVIQGSMLIDAQAQLNASATEAEGAPPVGTGTPFPPLTDAQRKALLDYLALVDAVTSSLASDNLAEFNTQATRAHAGVPALRAALTNAGPWEDLIAPLEATSHLERASELKAARRSFHRFSLTAVALAQALQRHETSFSSLKVFRCPMTKDAFPGAPKSAEWIQLRPEVRNPWFGAEMIDCGSEVKP